MLTLEQATAAALSLSRLMDCEPVYVLKQGVDIFLISTVPSSDAYPNARVCAEICARFTPSDRPDPAEVCVCGHMRTVHVAMAGGCCTGQGAMQCPCSEFREPSRPMSISEADARREQLNREGR